MQSGKRPRLSRESIVAAAMALADAEGLAAVSIRRVAAELGARTMTLYSHIESKEGLLDLMADEIAGEILIAGELPGDWRAAIGLIVRRTREVMLGHRWVSELMSTRTHVGPNAVRHVEQSLAAVAPLALDASASARVITALDDFAVGHVSREIVNVDVQRWQRMLPQLRILVEGGGFPHVGRLLAAEPKPAPDESFEQGLKWLLDGIAREYGGPPPPGTGTAAASVRNQ